MKRARILTIIGSIVSGGVTLLGVMLMVVSFHQPETQAASFLYSAAMVALGLVGSVLALAGNLGVIVCGFLFWSSCGPYQHGIGE